MQKLSSFGRGKKFRPKKSLTSLLHAALQLLDACSIYMSLFVYILYILQGDSSFFETRNGVLTIKAPFRPPPPPIKPGPHSNKHPSFPPVWFSTPPPPPPPLHPLDVTLKMPNVKKDITFILGFHQANGNEVSPVWL